MPLRPSNPETARRLDPEEPVGPAHAGHHWKRVRVAPGGQSRRVRHDAEETSSPRNVYRDCALSPELFHLAGVPPCTELIDSIGGDVHVEIMKSERVGRQMNPVST